MLADEDFESYVMRLHDFGVPDGVIDAGTTPERPVRYNYCRFRVPETRTRSDIEKLVKNTAQIALVFETIEHEFLVKMDNAEVEVAEELPGEKIVVRGWDDIKGFLGQLLEQRR